MVFPVIINSRAREIRSCGLDVYINELTVLFGIPCPRISQINIILTMQQRSVNSTNTLVEQQSIASNGPLRPSGDYSALSPCASPTAPINTIDVNPNADHTQESRHRHDDASSSGFAGVPRAIKQLLSVSAFVNNDEGLIQLDMDGEGSKNGFFRRARARIGAAVKHDEPRHQVYTAQSDAEGRSTAETTLVASHVDKVKVDCKGTKGEPSARKLRKLEKSKRRVESRGVPVMNIVMFIVGSRGACSPRLSGCEKNCAHFT